MKIKKKIEVEIDVDGIYCGKDCSFQVYGKDICNLYNVRESVHYYDTDGKHKRCKQCLSVFGKELKLNKFGK